MSDIISITGTVATDPRHSIAGTGLPVTSFRLASSQRRYDRAAAKWIEAPTNWFTVSTFGAIAMNAATSLRKGERVVLRGRLQVRDWNNGERSGTTVEVIAESIGHDLLWGTTAFTRTAAAPAPAEVGSSMTDASTPDTATSAEQEQQRSGGWGVPGAAAEPADGALVEVPF